MPDSEDAELVTVQWSPPERSSGPLKIISLDGGGIRGFLTAHILERLFKEQNLGESEMSYIQSADVFAGSSVGSMLAVLLAMGRSPEQIVKFAREKVPQVFSRSLWEEIEHMGQTIGSKYSNKIVRELLEEEIGADTRLKDIPKPVFITTFDTRGGPNGTRWCPRYFTQFHAADLDEKVVDVIMRSAAAPTYFPMHQGYVDGGCFANDPTLCCITSVMRHADVPLSQIM
eukprot:862238_1